jgi:4-amino-4-deoxy-L-arabinose transferase-like glycosyltransferase
VVATNRTNLVDPQLVLTSLLAAWAVLLATETEDARRRLGWFLLAALAIAVGFNIKSSQALLPAPAIFLVYLTAARETWLRKLASCALAGAILVVVGLAWPVIYDAVPEDERPWVGSTETNRQMELIFSYNTANRFQSDPTSRTGAARAPGFDWFYGRESGGQIGWLLPLAAVGAVAAWRGRPRLPLDRPKTNLLLWIAWAVPQLIFFALAEFIHSYYLVMLAPAVAALSGIGVVALRDR